MKKAMISLCLLLCPLVASGISHATPLLDNGGFEGGLAGWNSSNVAFDDQVTTSDGKTVSAHEGTYMAVLSPGLGSQDAGLSQVINAGVGQQLVLSFAYNMQGKDLKSGDGGREDRFIATISVGFASTVLVSEWIDDSSGDSITRLYGWKTFTAPLPVLFDPMTDMTLSFYLENTALDGTGNGDEWQNASAYVDAVSVRSVPDASIMFLLGPGLVGLGLLGRRKFKK